MKVTTVGIDLVKAVFAVHGVDGRGKTAFRKSLKRTQVLTFFANFGSLLDRHGGLWQRPPLGPAIDRPGTHGEAHGPAIREALCQD